VFEIEQFAAARGDCAGGGRKRGVLVAAAGYARGAGKFGVGERIS